MLVVDELLDDEKNRCLTPVDFLEALVRLADAMQGSRDSCLPVEESFEVWNPWQSAISTGMGYMWKEPCMTMYLGLILVVRYLSRDNSFC